MRYNETYRKDIMLKRFFAEEQTALDDEIKVVHDELARAKPDSEQYPKLLSYLERLHKLKTQERRPRVSLDTMALVAGNLLGILLIGAIEKNHVMTSKGFTQLIRPTKQHQ